MLNVKHINISSIQGIKHIEIKFQIKNFKRRKHQTYRILSILKSNVKHIEYQKFKVSSI